MGVKLIDLAEGDRVVAVAKLAERDDDPEDGDGRARRRRARPPDEPRTSRLRGSMRFFLDTADPEEARRVRDWGLLDGILLRPESAEMSGRDARRVLADLAQVGDGPVDRDARGRRPEGDVQGGPRAPQARQERRPARPDDARGPPRRAPPRRRADRHGRGPRLHGDAGPSRRARGQRLRFSPSVGELDDAGQIGMDVVESIVRVFDNYGLETQICVQGIQNPIHVLDAAALGADVATLPFAVLDRLFDHPLTARGVASLRSPPSDGPRRIH